jgi:hypothetical protein
MMIKYKPLRLSVIRFIKQIAADFMAKHPGSQIEFVDLDAVEDLEKLPAADCMGLSAFALQPDENMADVFFAVALSTWSDPDNLRLIDMVDLACDYLLPGCKVEVWSADPATNPPSGFMVVANDTSIDPVDRDGHRAIQFINLRLKPIAR